MSPSSGAQQAVGSHAAAFTLSLGSAEPSPPGHLSPTQGLPRLGGVLGLGASPHFPEEACVCVCPGPLRAPLFPEVKTPVFHRGCRLPASQGHLPRPQGRLGPPSTPSCHRTPTQSCWAPRVGSSGERLLGRLSPPCQAPIRPRERWGSAPRHPHTILTFPTPVGSARARFFFLQPARQSLQKHGSASVGCGATRLRHELAG